MKTKPAKARGKRRYYYLQENYLSDYGVTKEPRSLREIDFTGGKRIRKRLPKSLVFEVDFPSPRAIEHMFNLTIPIFSDALLKVLRASGADNFQAFPVVLKSSKARFRRTGYWAVNVLDSIIATNMRKSKYVLILAGDSRSGIPPLVGFKTGKIVLSKRVKIDKKMFRLAESSEILVVDDEVMSHLAAQRPKNGWGLYSTELKVA